jgi:hypothetical protein
MRIARGFAIASAMILVASEMPEPNAEGQFTPTAAYAAKQMRTIHVFQPRNICTECGSRRPPRPNPRVCCACVGGDWVGGHCT